MDKYPKEETEGDNRTKDIGSIPGNDQGFVDGDIESLLDESRGQEDLTADDPGKEWYNEEKGPVEENRNPIDSPDPE
jgi:hypothetical protein